MTTAESAVAVRVHRFEVRSADPDDDPRGAAALRSIRVTGAATQPDLVRHAAVYLVAGRLDDDQLGRVAAELLADPVTEVASAGAVASEGVASIEVHPLPGVTDPAAESVELALRALLGVDVSVRTGDRWDLAGVDSAEARAIVERTLANPVIHAIHDEPFHPDAFVVGHPYELVVREIPLRELDDDALERLSREAHLFLSLDEMRCLREEYRTLGREPREIELETIAQTWSEHCVHKTLKATIRYTEPHGPGPTGVSFVRDVADRPGHALDSSGGLGIDNLLRSTVAAATFELMDDGIDWCLSVFVDNAGIIAFDDEHAVCFKAETHNHPSAIEPYGGAATGIGGCIRDIMGTGLAAKPIAATDVFCVADPTRDSVPAGCLHPRRVLSQVVAGVRDYGNRMGIPTLNGTVWIDDAYIGNPLVFCGCIGVMPRDAVAGAARPGDRIIAIGGRTGRDGIHGATFSSAELTDTHADEFSHAVQIGNPIIEKKALDAILELRDHPSGCLFSAITDCGAGGFSSAVGEMGEELGAEVDLERAPLKYDGLSPVEVWISEAQERMVLAVDAANVDAIAEICAAHEVEWCDLGVFGTPERDLILRWHGTEIGRLPMSFLHDGVPMPVREATWDPAWTASELAAHAEAPSHDASDRSASGMLETARALLGHPNLASKQSIIRQYDHEVQGGSVLKPLVGVGEGGPGDAAVVRPVPSSARGLAIANGLATGLARDPYAMGLAAIDECVRNLVCVGADPERIAILDNFCWPGCADARALGSLVRAAEACLDGARAFRTPFVSGKDSLNNQFTTEDGTTIRIPPTLLISGMAIVEDSARCVSMDAKAPGSLLLLVGETTDVLGGSHVARIAGIDDERLPLVDLVAAPARARAVARLIASGLVRSAHDCSEGGAFVAAIEMAFAGGLGLTFDAGSVPGAGSRDAFAAAFAETPSRYLLEVDPMDLDAVLARMEGHPVAVVGGFTDRDDVELRTSGGAESHARESLARFESAWRGGLVV